MKRILFSGRHSADVYAAVLDNERLITAATESRDGRRKGDIYKGLVRRIEPTREKAVVQLDDGDTGGLLPLDQVPPIFRKRFFGLFRAREPDALKERDQLIVQVEHDSPSDASPRLTGYIQLAGRFFVLMPVARDRIGVDSCKPESGVEVPSGVSVATCAAAAGRTRDELQADIDLLLKLWRAIEQAADQQDGPFLIYQGSNLIIRTILDHFGPDVTEILVDTQDIFEQVRQFVIRVVPDYAKRVKLYNDDTPLFSLFGVDIDARRAP